MLCDLSLVTLPWHCKRLPLLSPKFVHLLYKNTSWNIHLNLFNYTLSNTLMRFKKIFSYKFPVVTCWITQVFVILKLSLNKSRNKSYGIFDRPPFVTQYTSFYWFRFQVNSNKITAISTPFLSLHSDYNKCFHIWVNSTEKRMINCNSKITLPIIQILWINEFQF